VSDGLWTVDEYRTPQGNLPVRGFIEGLSLAAQARVLAAVRMLREHGSQLAFPQSRALGKRLFELRIDHPEGPFRLFYCFRPGRRIVLLHAIIKRTRQTPPQEMNLARRRMDDLEG
jgi:phage-related protein